jgi:RND family efflux transporter MFP subunit
MKLRLLLMCLVAGSFFSGIDAREYPVAAGNPEVIPALDCVIEPSEIVDVGSPVAGVVESIKAYRSDLVKQGDVIAQLESSVEQASYDLEQARASVSTAIKLRQEGAAFGNLTQKRNQALLQKAIISKHEMDQMETETRIANLQVQQEKESKRIAGLEAQRAKAALQRRTITSPLSGVVMERFKSVGEYVDDEPLVRLAQLDPLHVEVIVPVDYLGRIAPGMQAEVTATAGTNGTYTATVKRVDRVVDAASNTFGVQLSLDNKDYAIPAGLRCKVNFLKTKLQPPVQETGKEAVKAEVVPAAPEAASKQVAVETQPVQETPDSTTEASDVEASSMEKRETLACYAIGPIKEKKLAGMLSNRIRQWVPDLRSHDEEVSLEKGFVVVSAEQGKTTQQMLAQIKKAGIEDRYIFPNGEHKGKISLGTFHYQASAEKRQQQLTRKGIDTEVLPYHELTTQYWLDIPEGFEQQQPDVLGKISSILTPSTPLSPVVCS